MSNAYKAADIGKAATAVVKVQTLAATQAAVGATTKVATNAVEGKPLGEGVGTAAAVAATVVRLAVSPETKWQLPRERNLVRMPEQQ